MSAVPALRDAIALPDRLELRWDDGSGLTVPWIWVRDPRRRAVVPPGHPAASAVDGRRRPRPHGLVGHDRRRRRGGGVVRRLHEFAADRLRRGARRPNGDGAGGRAAGDVGCRDDRAAPDRPRRGDGRRRRGGALVASRGPHGLRHRHRDAPTAAATRSAHRSHRLRARDDLRWFSEEFTADLSKADTAYTNLELRPHTGSTYSARQGCSCCTAWPSTAPNGEHHGGRLPHRPRAARQCARAVRRCWRRRSPVGTSATAALRAARPVFRLDHDGELVQVSFNNADRAPLVLPHDSWSPCTARCGPLRPDGQRPRSSGVTCCDPARRCCSTTEKACCTAAPPTGNRRLCGAYLNHEDFESRLRLAGPTVASTRA
ncbi:MAG: hypothetical protein R2713_16410 [Ilumatobacteraceae bacterium]